MQHIKILMVEDDPDELDLIEEALLDVGQKLHYVQNGIEALNYLETCSNLPYLIVLDLNMPKLNGTETLGLLKAHNLFKDITVVIYSTSVNVLEKEKCMSLGAHSYLVKPLTYADTLKTAKYLAELCITDEIKNDRNQQKSSH